MSASDQARLDHEPFTYAEVGATGRATMPPGYHYQHHQAVVGRGRRAFEESVERLMTWRMHAGSGFTVYASNPRVEPGSVVSLAVGPRALGLGGACRVVWVREGAGAVSWAYGTLAGHPEAGEESFGLTLARDGAVIFAARSFSRPAGLAFRLAGPAGRLAQSTSLRLYARALQV